MKKYKRTNIQIGKRIVAGILCLTLVAALPISNGPAYATEPTTTEATTTEATTTEKQLSSSKVEETTTEANVDANGKLGKNSDVTIELGQSIKGTIGQAVTIAFTLHAGNDKINLLGVYPSIDAAFPFETSGDAYKNVPVNPADPFNLGASYVLTARSDLEKGYHGVKFIVEYTKQNPADGTTESYYVIKTINIYFGEPEVATTTEKKSKKKTTTEKETSSDTMEDDDSSFSSYDMDGGDEEATGPKLLITGYDIDADKIMAGAEFNLTIHIQNTSKTVSVCNGKFLIGNEAGDFLPTSGSNAVFIESIPAGETGDLEIGLKAGANLTQKNYILVVKGEFDDGKGNAFTSSDNLTLPVYQEIKLSLTEGSLSPSPLMAGESGSLMFTINNQSAAGIYNVNVKPKDDKVTGVESYVGNIAGNASAYATLEVTGASDDADYSAINVEISYEDAEGNVATIEQEVACTSVFDTMGDGYEEDWEDAEEEYDAFPWWIVIVVVVIVLLAAGVVTFLVIRKKKAAKDVKEEDDDDWDFDDEEDDDEAVVLQEVASVDAEATDSEGEDEE